MRSFAIVAVTAAMLFFGFVAASNAATTPTQFGFGTGGGFTNPCNGDPVSFFVTGTGLVVPSAGTFLVKEHGVGTGSDGVTGETYDVTFDLIGTNALDGSGSFTGHVVIVFVGQVSKATTVVHSVANVNFRPTDPSIVEIQYATCAGVGQQGF